METTWHQLGTAWTIFLDATCKPHGQHFEKTLGQLSDKFEISLRPFETILIYFLDNFAIQAPALIKGTFSNHLDTNWAWQHGRHLGIIWWPLRFPFLVFSKLAPTQWGGAYLCPVGTGQHIAIVDMAHFLLLRNLTIRSVNTCEYETKSHNALLLSSSYRDTALALGNTLR